MQKSELKIGEVSAFAKVSADKNPAHRQVSLTGLQRSYDYIEIKNVQKQGDDG